MLNDHQGVHMLVYNQPKHRANIDYSSESQSQELNNTLYSVNSPA